MLDLGRRKACEGGVLGKILHEVLMKKSAAKNNSDKKVKKKSTQTKKPLPGKPARAPGLGKGKVIIKPDFDQPLPEFDL